MQESVIAVIPVFNPPMNLLDRVRRLLEDIDGVILVDDGSHSIDAFPGDIEGLHLIDLEKNSGIAHALNVGISRARELGADSVLTLDQDSAPRADYVRRGLDLRRNLEAGGASIGAMVPEFIGAARVMMDSAGRAFDPIQSGQIISMSTLEEVGSFREDFFIDTVDSEYTVRMEERGLTLAVIPGSHIDHELGELVPLMVFGRQLRILGKPRHVLYHKPWRTYYMVRNSIVFSAEYGPRRRRWMARRWWKLSEMVIGCVLLSPDRGAQLRAVRLGVRDGRRRSLGKISDQTLERLASSTGPS